jgi:hypothetical protein
MALEQFDLRAYDLVISSESGRGTWTESPEGRVSAFLCTSMATTTRFSPTLKPMTVLATSEADPR